MPSKYKPKYDVRPLTAVVPIQLMRAEDLVQGTNLHPDRIRVFLHQIYTTWIFNNMNEKKSDDYYHKEGWVTLSSKRLQRLLTQNYNRYEFFLEHAKIIEIKRNDLGNKSYVQNERSTPYRIHPSLLKKIKGRRFKLEKIFDYKTLKSIKLDREHFAEEINSTEFCAINAFCEVHYNLSKMMDDFYFETEQIDSFLSMLESGEIITTRETLQGVFDAEMLIHLVNEGSLFTPVVCNFGERFHSVFTRIPREYRQFLKLKNSNEELCSIDISNCQPYLIALICSHPDLISVILPEFIVVLNKLKSVSGKTRRHFFELCAAGKIYEFWVDTRSLNSRDDAKDEIIKRILFDSFLYKPKEFASARKKFKEWFPDIWNCIVLMKSITENELPIIKEIFLDERKNFGGKKFYHKTVSCMCQRLESRLMIHVVVPELIKNNVGSFLTVHDSILLPISKSALVKQVIIDCFKKLGVQPPKVKIDVYETISYKTIK